MEVENTENLPASVDEERVWPKSVYYAALALAEAEPEKFAVTGYENDFYSDIGSAETELVFDDGSVFLKISTYRKRDSDELEKEIRLIDESRQAIYRISSRDGEKTYKFYSDPLIKEQFHFNENDLSNKFDIFPDGRVVDYSSSYAETEIEDAQALQILTLRNELRIPRSMISSPTLLDVKNKFARSQEVTNNEPTMINASEVKAITK